MLALFNYWNVAIALVFWTWYLNYSAMRNFFRNIRCSYSKYLSLTHPVQCVESRLCIVANRHEWDFSGNATILAHSWNYHFIRSPQPTGNLSATYTHYRIKYSSISEILEHFEQMIPPSHQSQSLTPETFCLCFCLQACVRASAEFAQWQRQRHEWQRNRQRP